MLASELAEILTERCAAAEKREKVVAIHPAGIEFANELVGQPINEIAEIGTGHASYGTEIRKGIRLARFVALRG
ncbi:hypothetical protein AL035_17540 [Salipiger aestuarii]|uniref:HTH-like domain-containing protein n=1 Tax=Salipiger aestuarii TaxID=568098 RepID=A0A327XUC6_9RHOB|nr:hypothetical protein [Salipiger aestuarii]KAB2539845.1 hypothetical protein AL035_17540 [Salipiger aestuarii]RAK10975.1 hypothetical protein ATI53_105311 [Salipiger aestuarii]